ncbi:MAG: acyl-CoA thioesterase II [Proteobacteria bacterium]|nr:acyl-CoA thioesterase II [Pseudomonadota bacterium]
MSDDETPAEPTPEELVADLIALLNVAETGTDSWRGRRKKGGIGRVFGGQVIAQALVAAERTVDPARAVHSLHAYFLRGGNEDFEIDYEVARDFDGGSFSNRRVVASQQGRPILNFTASFQVAEEGVHHQIPMPEVPGPDELLSVRELLTRAGVSSHHADGRRHMFKPQPVEMRPVNPGRWGGLEQGEARQEIWIRTVAPLPDDPALHRAILAYASDFSLLSTAAIPHGLNFFRRNIQAASLDHAVWFHEPFRADEWLLYATDSPWAGHGRGYNRGRIYTRDGRLVAEAAQEGLIRRRVETAS